MLQGVCSPFMLTTPIIGFANRLVVQPHRPHEGAVRRTIETIGRHTGSQLLHAHNFSAGRPGERPDGNAQGRLSGLSAYCSGATIVGCLNCATSIFGSIPVAA